MQSIQKANHAVLSRQRVEGNYINLGFSAGRGMPLSDLLQAVKEPDLAWSAFRTFWDELRRPGRPPVLFVLDGLQHMMRVSDYRAPNFELIHSHDLALLRVFAEALGGKTQFPNGAAVLGITTRGNSPRLASVDMALEQAAAAQRGDPVPPRDPFYRRYDERVFDALRGVQVRDIRGITKPEARGLLEYWAASGILRARVDEYAVADRWAMAGGGIPAEMERVALYDNRISM
jgi:small subunit ribosomal protein S29